MHIGGLATLLLITRALNLLHCTELLDWVNWLNKCYYLDLIFISLYVLV